MTDLDRNVKLLKYDDHTIQYINRLNYLGFYSISISSVPIIYKMIYLRLSVTQSVHLLHFSPALMDTYKP